MSQSHPVLHLLAGPNGAGKTTFHDTVLAPVLNLPFVNADLIAAQRWPGEELLHAHQAAADASTIRARLLERRGSFVTETVFSHPSKVELVQQAANTGYLVYLYVLLVPVELALARVVQRVADGGHDVPPDKVRQRHQRLWTHVAAAIRHTYEATVYDSTQGSFVPVARYQYGRLVASPRWPPWTPTELRETGGR